MLKTNYVDDAFTGNRKYRMTTNQDGTVSFTDETSYLQTGDNYGAAQINEANDYINKKGITVSSTRTPVSSRVENQLYFFYS